MYSCRLVLACDIISNLLNIILVFFMQTPAYDLKSLLAMKLKRKIMLALMDKDFCHNNPARQEELYEKYTEYFIPV